jgi:hypothetical protein
MAALLLIVLLIQWPDVELLYGPKSLARAAQGHFRLTSTLPTLSDLLNWISIRTGVESRYFLHSVYGIHVAFAAATAVNWLPKLSSTATWLLFFLFKKENELITYGVDQVTLVLLFYSAILSHTEISEVTEENLDPRKDYINIGLCVIRIHLCIIYLSAGFGKAISLQWWNGMAIRRAFLNEQFVNTFFSQLLELPGLAMALGLVTIVVEVTYPWFIWVSTVRPIWLVLIVGMHVGIAVGLGLWHFSGVMIAANLAAFWNYEETRAVAGYVGRRLGIRQRTP